MEEEQIAKMMRWISVSNNVGQAIVRASSALQIGALGGKYYTVFVGKNMSNNANMMSRKIQILFHRHQRYSPNRSFPSCL